ncbi:MAG: PilZ domain-containing protein [Planctomycetota bacterium]|nr:PilZ domain-containing protein [Planctomycetota bacterium]
MRQFGKIQADISVLYKFITKDTGTPEQSVHQGTSRDISATGLTLRAQLPEPSILHSIISGNTYIGLNIILPNRESPVKALSRLIWLEIDERDPRFIHMGLKFVTIDKSDKDELTRFVIRSQISRGSL